MSEDWRLVGDLVTGALGGSGVAGFVAATLKDRWLADAKAQSDRELEIIKDQLAKGAYITKAHFDIELTAYKELWRAMSDLRNSARALLFSYKVPQVIEGADDKATHRAKYFAAAVQPFHDAHNIAVFISDRDAPFIEPEIRKVAHAITESDMKVLEFYGDMISHSFSDDCFDGLEVRIAGVTSQIERLADIIRGRISGIRLID